MKKIVTFIIVSLMCTNILFAQKVLKSSTEIKTYDITRPDGSLSIKLDFLLNKTKIDSRSAAIMTPYIVSNDGSYSEELSPVIINGETRHKAYKRSKRLNGYPIYANKPFSVSSYKTNSDEIIKYKVSVPFSKWMENAKLIIKENIIGCADCPEYNSTITLLEEIMPKPYIPEWQVSYIEHNKEKIKNRDRTFSCNLDFKVSNYTIYTNYHGNRNALLELDRAINSVKLNNDLKIQKISIIGYSSPDGNTKSNFILSEKRAASFYKYVLSKYNIDKNIIDVSGKGEDWEGLERIVAKSNIDKRDEVLSILRSNNNLNEKKRQLKSMQKEYYNMVRNIYPTLRRNEIKFHFIAKHYSIDDTMNIIYKEPDLLSLYEMQLFANSLPKNSEEFHKIMYVGANTFPNNDIAKINAITSAIINKDYDMAEKWVEKLENNPKAFNNLGIIYSMRKEFRLAEEMFNKAIQNGYEQAKHNLEQMKLLEKDIEFRK